MLRLAKIIFDLCDQGDQPLLLLLSAPFPRGLDYLKLVDETPRLDRVANGRVGNRAVSQDYGTGTVNRAVSQAYETGTVNRAVSQRLFSEDFSFISSKISKKIASKVLKKYKEGPKKDFKKIM